MNIIRKSPQGLQLTGKEGSKQGREAREQWLQGQTNNSDHNRGEQSVAGLVLHFEINGSQDGEKETPNEKREIDTRS